MESQANHFAARARTDTAMTYGEAFNRMCVIGPRKGIAACAEYREAASLLSEQFTQEQPHQPALTSGVAAYVRDLGFKSVSVLYAADNFAAAEAKADFMHVVMALAQRFNLKPLFNKDRNYTTASFYITLGNFELGSVHVLEPREENAQQKLIVRLVNPAQDESDIEEAKPAVEEPAAPVVHTDLHSQLFDTPKFNVIPAAKHRRNQSR